MFFNFYLSAAVPIYTSTKDIASNMAQFQSLHPIEQLKNITSMNAEQFGKMRGKKLNLMERLAFKMVQNRAKHLLRDKKSDTDNDNDNANNVLAFLVGMLSSFILPVTSSLVFGIVLLFYKGKNRDLLKWALIGSLIGLLLFIILLFAIISGFR